MIELSYHGGLGNTLFQYCFSRILHERTGLTVAVRPSTYIQHLTNNQINRNHLGIQGFPQTFQPLDGRKLIGYPAVYLPHHNTPESINPDYEEAINLDSACSQILHTGCILAGFFQRYEYYRPWKLDIRKWLATDINATRFPGDKDVVVYVQSYFNIGPSFFTQSLKELSFDKLFVLVNDLERSQPFLKAMERFKPLLIHSTNPLEDFEFLRRARIAIVAPSSFSWWACWLSSAERIITARPDEGFGAEGHLVSDLVISDESRYEYKFYDTKSGIKKVKHLIRRLLQRRQKSFHRKFLYGEKIPVVEQVLSLTKRMPFISSIKTFVETGTNEGETIEMAAAHFPSCYTIELSKELHEQAAKRLAHTHIQFELGDSSEVLARLTMELKEPAVFYLDAHFSGGKTAQGAEDVPLLNEIAILGNRPFLDLIIVDDASLFGYSKVDGLNEDWSKIKPETVIAAFGKEGARHLVENDRMILWRESLMEAAI